MILKEFEFSIETFSTFSVVSFYDIIILMPIYASLSKGGI